MERKSGFYWVKCGGADCKVWVIAEYNSSLHIWFRVGRGVEFFDDEFYEINPNRIMSPDEWE